MKEVINPPNPEESGNVWITALDRWKKPKVDCSLKFDILSRKKWKNENGMICIRAWFYLSQEKIISHENYSFQNKNLKKKKYGNSLRLQIFKYYFLCLLDNMSMIRKSYFCRWTAVKFTFIIGIHGLRAWRGAIASHLLGYGTLAFALIRWSVQFICSRQLWKARGTEDLLQSSLIFFFLPTLNIKGKLKEWK